MTTAPGLAALRIDGERLLGRLRELARIGAIPGGGCARLALTDEDKAGRDLVVMWMRDAGLDVSIDGIGNVVATRKGREAGPAVMCGSHIDTVATGGAYDGNLGVLAGLEVLETLNDAGVTTRRPMAVAFFTDEEGARFAPDMLGSLVYAGGMGVEAAHDIVGIDGARLRDELERIGYLGPTPCPGLVPYAYVELHIEQGPVLDRAGEVIGAVTGIQGISWQELTFEGQANHAGTTPMSYRHDAGYTAAATAAYVREMVSDIGPPQVGTVGRFSLHPDLVNVVAARATMTVDLRNTDEEALQGAERRLAAYVEQVARSEGVNVQRRRLARFEPVEFDPRIISLVESTAASFGYEARRLPAGAGHDAQMLARVCPAGMVFVPSVRGISHNPAEHTDPEHLVAGANILLQTLLRLASEDEIPAAALAPAPPSQERAL
ncbi:MAG TPA: Zn-dependent hydrolase [Acidimicrobiales bacterium]|nr:Zn-dependent hydrolase [Acidimicrobiales bacterium]